MLLFWLGCVPAWNPNKLAQAGCGRGLWAARRPLASVQHTLPHTNIRSQDLDERASRRPTGMLSCLSKLVIPVAFMRFNIWVTRSQSLGSFSHFVINLETVTSISTNLWKAYVLLFSKRVVCFLVAFPLWCCSPVCCSGSFYSWGTFLFQKCWCRCTSMLCFAYHCEAESRWTNELTSRGHISQFEWCLKKCEQHNFACPFSSLPFQLQRVTGTNYKQMLLFSPQPFYY